MKPVYLLLCCLVLVSACNKDEDLAAVDGLPELFFGAWVEPAYEDSVMILTRSLFLKEDSPGFVFKRDGGFIQRTVAGWCATPPVVYENYHGVWEKVDENTYQINIDFWGNEALSYTWELVSVDAGKLKLIQTYD